MTTEQRRNKQKISSSLTIKNRSVDVDDTIPIPSRQGQLNDQTDFVFDPDLAFDELPQPFRRINQVLEQIFDDAWTSIENREQQRLIDSTKFVTAQHNSSTMIETSSPVCLVGSHINGHLCFFHGYDNEQPILICYDSQVDEVINHVNIEAPLGQLKVFKADSATKDAVYFFSVIDNLGFWKMYAYKNHQYYHLFTQYETEEESRRPTCVMTQTGINDEFLVVVWFTIHDSWIEVYKLSKDQWKSEITAHEQAALNNEANTDNLATPRPSEHGPTLIKGQFSRPALLLKAKAPKLNPGSNNIQQLMKSTDSSVNVGQGTNNHLYTQQVIDAKNILIKELVAPTPKVEGTDRHMIPPKPETPTPMTPIIHFIPVNTTPPTGPPSLVVSWPSTNQLFMYKIVKSEAKGKDAADTRPSWIWPFPSSICSLSYDSKREYLAVGLESGNVCIIERSPGIIDMPSVQNISQLPIRQMYSLESHKQSSNSEKNEKNSGFLALSEDGYVYRLKFQSMLSRDEFVDDSQNKPCFPQDGSKDASKIIRMIWLDSNSSTLFITVNQMNRLYVNDGVKGKQLCEIILPQSYAENINAIQISLIDQARHIIIGVSDEATRAFDQTQTESQNRPSLRLYRVPLEHFPSIASYYPERIPTATEEIESTVETKVSKVGSQLKKQAAVVEVDKTAIMFDEKIRELFRNRQAEAYERRERLRTRWNEIKLHYNPVHEQT